MTYKSKSILGVIPARGGSKRLPRKNVRNFAGKPLIAWTIEAARQSKYIDKLIVTSEDEEIIEISRRYGCEAPFLRPADLAQDNSSGMDVLRHAIEQLPGFDYLVELQPTSPLRTSADIDGCIAQCVDMDAEVCSSVGEVGKNISWCFTLSEEQTLEPVLSSVSNGAASIRPMYGLNGAVFVARSQWIASCDDNYIQQTLAYPMPKSRSIDIDTEEDFLLAEALHMVSRANVSGC